MSAQSLVTQLASLDKSDQKAVRTERETQMMFELVVNNSQPRRPMSARPQSAKSYRSHVTLSRPASEICSHDRPPWPIDTRINNSQETCNESKQDIDLIKRELAKLREEMGALTRSTQRQETSISGTAGEFQRLRSDVRELQEALVTQDAEFHKLRCNTLDTRVTTAADLEIQKMLQTFRREAESKMERLTGISTEPLSWLTPEVEAELQRREEHVKTCLSDTLVRHMQETKQEIGDALDMVKASCKEQATKVAEKVADSVLAPVQTESQNTWACYKEDVARLDTDLNSLKAWTSEQFSKDHPRHGQEACNDTEVLKEQIGQVAQRFEPLQSELEGFVAAFCKEEIGKVAQRFDPLQSELGALRAWTSSELSDAFIRYKEENSNVVDAMKASCNEASMDNVQKAIDAQLVPLQSEVEALRACYKEDISKLEVELRNQNDVVNAQISEQLDDAVQIALARQKKVNDKEVVKAKVSFSEPLDDAFQIAFNRLEQVNDQDECESKQVNDQDECESGGHIEILTPSEHGMEGMQMALNDVLTGMTQNARDPSLSPVQSQLNVISASADQHLGDAMQAMKSALKEELAEMVKSLMDASLSPLQSDVRLACDSVAHAEQKLTELAAQVKNGEQNLAGFDSEAKMLRQDMSQFPTLASTTARQVVEASLSSFRSEIQTILENHKALKSSLQEGLDDMKNLSKMESRISETIAQLATQAIEKVDCVETKLTEQIAKQDAVNARRAGEDLERQNKLLTQLAESLPQRTSSAVEAEQVEFLQQQVLDLHQTFTDWQKQHESNVLKGIPRAAEEANASRAASCIVDDALDFAFKAAGAKSQTCEFALHQKESEQKVAHAVTEAEQRLQISVDSTSAQVAELRAECTRLREALADSAQLVTAVTEACSKS